MQMHNSANIAVWSHQRDRTFVLCYTIYLVHVLVSQSIETHLGVLSEANWDIRPFKPFRPDWMNNNELNGVFRKDRDNLITYGTQRSS